MKWEYMTLKIGAEGGFLSPRTLNCAVLNEKMNEFGKYGWELVSGFDINAFKGETNSAVLIFKRPLDVED